MSRYKLCTVAGEAGMNGRSVSRYTVLYRDREEGLVVGECVTIQILYRDRRRTSHWRNRVTIQLIVS